jgi:hypothetical protein
MKFLLSTLLAATAVNAHLIVRSIYVNGVDQGTGVGIRYVSAKRKQIHRLTLADFPVSSKGLALAQVPTTTLPYATSTASTSVATSSAIHLPKTP